MGGRGILGGGGILGRGGILGDILGGGILREGTYL